MHVQEALICPYMVQLKSLNALFAPFVSSKWCEKSKIAETLVK